MNWLRSRSRVRGRPPHPDVLTPAEWRVLEHLREGQTNPEIAETLGLSLNTVKTHVSSMLAKLNLPDRGALAAWDGEPRRTPRVWGLLGGWGRAAAVGGVVVSAVLLFVAVAVAPSGLRGGSVVTPTPPVVSEEDGPLQQRPGLPVVVDTGRLEEWFQGRQEWFWIDPDSGAWGQRPPVHGRIPSRWPEPRYETVSGPNFDPPTALEILDTTTGETRVLDEWASANVASSGRWAAVSTGDEDSLVVLDLQTGATHDLSTPGHTFGQRWSESDVLAAVYVAPEPRTYWLRMASAPDWQWRDLERILLTVPTWSPDGEHLAFTSLRGEVVVARVDVAAGALVDRRALTAALPADEARYNTWRLVWSPDGERLAYYARHQVEVIDVQVGAHRVLALPASLFAHSPVGSDPAWSPDGRRLAFNVSERGGQRSGVVVAQADGSGAYLLTEGPAEPFLGVIGWDEDGLAARVWVNAY